ncbi:MAG TPA: hypothetical protein VNG33_22740, partial [Polyangiaceae bacterium]|nr:hypothetical protein [Polyangiaceae bacterium]
MADDAAQGASEGATAGAGTGAAGAQQSGGQPAGGWRLVAVAFLSVLAVAGFLFEQHRRSRLAELNEQLSQDVARIGGEAELKFRNYQQIVDNVTRVLSSATKNATEARGKAESESDGRAKRLEQDKQLAKDRQEQVRAELRKAAKNAKLSDETLKQLEAAETKAWETYHEALDKQGTASEGVDSASQAVQDAEGLVQKLNAELAALSPATTVVPESGVANGSVAASQQAAGDAAPAQAAPTSVEPPDVTVRRAKLTQQLTETRAQLADARSKLTEAKSVLSSAAQRALQASGGVDNAVDSWAKEVDQSSSWEKIKADTEQALQKAQTDAQAATQKQEAEKKQRERLGAGGALQYLNTLSDWVPPSHRQPLMSACSNGPDGLPLELCIARTIALINDVKDMDIVPCSGNGPSLSRDRHSLLIPPSTQANANANATAAASVAAPAAQPSDKAPPAQRQVACGQVKLERLFGDEQPSLASPDRGSLDTVLLAEPDGAVLVTAKSRSNLQIRNLPGVDAKAMRASSVVQNLPLGTSGYRAFVRPVGIQPASACSEQPATCDAELGRKPSLVVVGLAREDSINLASIEINLSYYLWFVLLLGTGLLSLPLAKLWLTGRMSRFRRFDVTALVSSGLLLTLLGVVLVLAFLAHNRLSARADRQATLAARTLEQRLSERVRKLAGALEQFDGDSRTTSLSRS